MEKMNGYKTYSGLVVTLLGTLGVAKYFGTSEELATVVDTVISLIGLLLAAYGRYKTKEANKN